MELCLDCILEEAEIDHSEQKVEAAEIDQHEAGIDHSENEVEADGMDQDGEVIDERVDSCLDDILID